MKRTVHPGNHGQELPAFSAETQPMAWTTKVMEPFLSSLEECVHRPNILDLGPISGRNISFFGTLGWKVYAHDLVRDYHETLERVSAESEDTPGPDEVGVGPSEATLDGLDFPQDSLNGVLLWDILDKLPHALAFEVVRRVSVALAPGGLMVSFFGGHQPREDRTNGRFRIRDKNRIMYIPQAPSRFDQWFYQNSEIMGLFDHLRILHFYTLNNGYREILVQRH